MCAVNATSGTHALPYATPVKIPRVPRPPLCSLLLATALTAQPTTNDELPLPARHGWLAAQLHQSDKGIWYAHAAKVVEAYAAPELIAADDHGRLILLTVYSGRWTMHSVNPDGQWLAPSRPADVDPRIPGREVYCAGKAGNVHRVWTEPRPFGRFELRSVEIGHAAGEEFHAVLAGDLDPARRGDELLAFGLSGVVYELTAAPAAEGGDKFGMRKLADIAGRVRDALILPREGDGATRILAVSRSGHLFELQLHDGQLSQRALAQETSGLGRLALAPRGKGDPLVVYATRDDGLLLRFMATTAGAWQREPIFAGPQGLRGVAAGRFFADPQREAVATFGYGKEVHLISRLPGQPWQAESIYTDQDQGHWLTVGEFDGRNGTDEIVATGFGGRVVLLSRPVGYALPGVATPPTPAPTEPTRPLRLAVTAGESAVNGLSPLSYQGGFETKSLVFETLLRCDEHGEIAPGLAAQWRIEDGGKVFQFTLRDGATFHDGTAVTGEAVRAHFLRWLDQPAHGWLRAAAQIRAVSGSGKHLRIELAQPAALLEDLCAINPTAITAPAMHDAAGKLRAPLGSGPFRLVEARERGRVLRYERMRDGQSTGRFVDLVRFDRDSDDVLAALERGEIDAAIGSWSLQLDPQRVAELRSDPRWQVLEAPGSAVTSLAFRNDTPAGADRRLRRLVAAALDRAALIAEAEAGQADPCTGWAAPCLRAWPKGTPPPREASPPSFTAPLRLAGHKNQRLQRVAKLIAAQLGQAGIAAEVVAPEAPHDAFVDVSHGAPYDPLLTLAGRFLPPPPQPSVATAAPPVGDAKLAQLVTLALATADPKARTPLYGQIQTTLDAEAYVVPLYAARRLAVLAASLPQPRLTPDMYHLDAQAWLDPQ